MSAILSQNRFGEQLQEIYYYVNDGDILRDDNTTKESTSVKISDAGNKELTEALTTGDGPLQAGLQPAVRAANEAGQKALLQSLQEGEVAGDGKKQKKDKKEKTEKCEPKTFMELLSFHWKHQGSMFFTYLCLNIFEPPLNCRFCSFGFRNMQ